MTKHVQVRGLSWLASEYHVALGKTGHTLSVATERLSDEVLAHVFNYGLKQMLNDAAASGKTDAEKVGLANKKLEAMLAGTLRAARESDPVAREAKRIATDYVIRKTTLKAGTDEFKAAVVKAQALPAVQSAAQAAVERAKALDFDIEL